MSIVFVPKIGDHLRKTQGTVRHDALTKELEDNVIKLRCQGFSFKDTATILGKNKGSIASMVKYYDLQDAIDEAKESNPSPCIGVCKLDDNHVCTGCGRTIEQITNHPKSMVL